MEKGTNFLYSVKYQQNTQKRGSHMSNLNTELMTALLKNESIDEVFRSHLETAMNDLLKIELTQSKFQVRKITKIFITQMFIISLGNRIAPNKIVIIPSKRNHWKSL